jgi:phosphohistidine phosphatase
MTTLVLLRHAKSAYPLNTQDFDRPLAGRGIHDAPLAGAWIRDNVAALDRVVVSSAARALQTWELADTELEFEGPLTIDPRIYEAAPDALLTVVRELPDTVGAALLVGHNPGLELLVRMLARTGDPAAVRAVDEKYPTSGIAVLTIDSSWRELREGSARLSAFAVPR